MESIISSVQQRWWPGNSKHFRFVNCYSGSVDGRHPAPIEVGSASHSFTGFFSSQVVVSDFSPPYSSDVFSGTQTCNWVGATQVIFHFHLYPWGRWTHFDEHLFKNGLVQPPTTLRILTAQKYTGMGFFHHRTYSIGKGRFLLRASGLWSEETFFNEI